MLLRIFYFGMRLKASDFELKTNQGVACGPCYPLILHRH
jgi:hypothetical protein